jgi:hypothetical protein
MLRIIAGRWIASATGVAAKLGVADELAAGPKQIDAVATAVGAHADSLRRLLRALASVGIFAEDDQGRFANTPLSETLRSGPGSFRAMVIMAGEAPVTRAWDELLHSVRTGASAFEKVHGEGIFEYFRRDKEFARIFSDAMTSRSAMEAHVVTAAVDFSRAALLVDVAGGQGLLLASILAKTPSQRGVLFDMPAVVADAKPILERAGVASRCEVVGGNFFESVPGGADGYILKHILHDWDDPNCLTILRNIHAAAKPESRLFVIESVLAPGNAPHFGKLLDIQMLVMTHGGRERTRGEWATLLEAGGFALERVVETPSPVCVLDARRT